MTFLCVLIALQGVIGTVQYETHLPGELVWFHVACATLTWLCVLWSVAAAGRLEPRTVGNSAQIRASMASHGS